MADIPRELVDSMMMKCGRRCCICKRFRPTKLQVHHVVERSKGGANDEDNLIVTCFSCHTDVHSKVPFARRFSVAEQKGHRDALIKMVADGTLPSNDTDDTDEAIARVVQEMRAVARPALRLLPEAIEILTTAVQAEGPAQGLILSDTSPEIGLSILIGGRPLFDHDDRRAQAKYKCALDQLLQCRLVERRDDQLVDVTYEGYLACDEMLARGPEFLSPS
jgi:HNH endonuclease